mmetsp:Transcript_4261/g.6933  ORF Transcript_4261/g.6933 Transcript_4261/m.6933 type:complete len:168 (-) Transcript_4261:76-579(-)
MFHLLFFFSFISSICCTTVEGTTTSLNQETTSTRAEGMSYLGCMTREYDCDSGELVDCKAVSDCSKFECVSLAGLSNKFYGMGYRELNEEEQEEYRIAQCECANGAVQCAKKQNCVPSDHFTTTCNDKLKCSAEQCVGEAPSTFFSSANSFELVTLFFFIILSTIMI